MTRSLSTLLLAAAALGLPSIALGGLVGPGDLSVRVDPLAGDDARCALVQGNDPRPAVACRTIARVAALENAAPVGPAVGVVLEPGRHDVSGLVQFRGMVAMWGPGGVQALVNMTGRGALVFGGGVQAAQFGMTGTAPGTWMTATGPGAWLYGVVVARARADAPTVSLRADSASVYSSVITAPGHPTAMVIKGAGGIGFSTVSGGRLAVGPLAGGPDAPAPTVNGAVLVGGLVSWGGRPGVYNSAISTPEAQNSSAIEVRDEPGVAPPAVNYPFIALSSIWQRSCAAAIGVSRPAAAGRDAPVLLAGSLVRTPAPGCAAALTGGLGNGAGRTSATIMNNRVAPDPGPLDRLAAGFTAAILNSNTVGDPGVEGGIAGRDWPGGMMPAAGSPLLDRATDPFSAMAAESAPQSLSVPRYGEAGFRPRGVGGLRNPAPDIGAYERPDLLGAVPPPPPPGPDGINVQPAPDGGLAPVVNGMDGAIPAAGAPTAGSDTGQRTGLPSARKIARVGLVVRRTAPVAGPVRVRVRAFQAARVVVVLRRQFRDNDRVKRSRVIGRVVVRFARAGVRWVNVPLNSGARRGLVGVAATARQPGLDPGFDQDSLRLVGAEPVSLSAPSTLRAGTNRITVTTRRAGRVVVVARTQAGRVIGRSVFVSAGPGRRTVGLTLAPAGLVVGTIDISARIAGADPVGITRPAG